MLGWTSIRQSSDTGMRFSEYGDIILADRGFTIEEYVAMCGAISCIYSGKDATFTEEG